eukprot:15786880-Heterocapsa_arctica.AAC.1
MAAPVPAAAPAPAAGFESLERELSQMMMHGAAAVKQEPQMEQEPKMEVPVKDSVNPVIVLDDSDGEEMAAQAPASAAEEIC